VQLSAEFGHTDITPELAELVRQSGLRDGVLTVQMLGSTSAITTIEYEPGALSDLRQALDLLAPVGAEYAHNAAMGRRERILACAFCAAQNGPDAAAGGRAAGPRDLAAGSGDQPGQPRANTGAGCGNHRRKRVTVLADSNVFSITQASASVDPFWQKRKRVRTFDEAVGN
jgi:hypothetical protein